MFKEELMNKLVGYLEQIMFEKKKKKKERTDERCVWVTESLLLSKLKKSIKKKKTGQIIILFRLIKGGKNEDVPRASRTLFLNEIER